MLIDCDNCRVRGNACGDCVITVLLGAPPAGVELDEAERAAVAALAGQGLVPPLRLVDGPARAEPVRHDANRRLRNDCASATAW